MSNEKISELRNIPITDLVGGDLVLLVDTNENTSPTGETKVVTIRTLTELIISGAFVEECPFQHAYHSSNGLAFDQSITPSTNIDLRCYANYGFDMTEFSLMARMFVPSYIVTESVDRVLFGVGSNIDDLNSGQCAYIGIQNGDLIGYTNDGISQRKIVYGDFFSSTTNRVFDAVMTRDATGSLSLFLNSTKVGSLSGTSHQVSSSYIVINNGTTSYPNVECTIYEAKLFSSSLSQNEINFIFYGGSSNTHPSLLASYSPRNLNPGPTQWLDSKNNAHILLPTTGARASNPDKEFSVVFYNNGTSAYLGNGNNRPVLPENYVLTDAFVYSTGSPVLSVGSSADVAPSGSSGIDSWNNNRVPLTNAIYSRNILPLSEFGVAHTDQSLYVFYTSSAAPCTFVFEGYVAEYGPIYYAP
jgi:hypothetical protein